MCVEKPGIITVKVTTAAVAEVPEALARSDHRGQRWCRLVKDMRLNL